MVAELSHEIALRWMPLDFAADQSTLVQVMTWCRQSTSHYLSQCWPRSLSPYGVTRPQWVKTKILGQVYMFQAACSIRQTIATWQFSVCCDGELLTMFAIYIKVKRYYYYSCSRTTGECLKCIYNTGGFECGSCLPGFYGDPLALPKGQCLRKYGDPRVTLQSKENLARYSVAIWPSLNLCTMINPILLTSLV